MLLKRGIFLFKVKNQCPCFQWRSEDCYTSIFPFLSLQVQFGQNSVWSPKLHSQSSIEQGRKHGYIWWKIASFLIAATFKRHEPSAALSPCLKLHGSEGQSHLLLSQSSFAHWSYVMLCIVSKPLRKGLKDILN